jgi:hypothetical protein
MKKVIILCFLLGIVLAATPVLGQEKYEVITVKSSEVQSRVVIVTVQGANTRFELQCNTNISGCSALQPGSYVMVRLPKNWGTYVCANVEVYPTPVNPENLGQKLGEYCLIEK